MCVKITYDLFVHKHEASVSLQTFTKRHSGTTKVFYFCFWRYQYKNCQKYSSEEDPNTEPLTSFRVQPSTWDQQSVITNDISLPVQEISRTGGILRQQLCFHSEITAAKSHVVKSFWWFHWRHSAKAVFGSWCIAWCGVLQPSCQVIHQQSPWDTCSRFEDHSHY